MLKRDQNFELDTEIYSESYNSIREKRLNLISEIEKKFKIDLNDQDKMHLVQAIIKDSNDKDKLHPTLFKLEQLLTEEIKIIEENKDLPQESLSYLIPLRDLLHEAVDSTTSGNAGFWY